MTRTIAYTYFYHFAPQIVWEYLTRSELIAQWLMENDFQPIIGHEFTFRIRPMPSVEFDGIVYCRVLEVVPPETLSYTWTGGPGDGSLNMDSVVTWKLIPKPDGTELQLVHSGFIENLSIYDLMNEGWLKNMKRIAELAATVKND